MTTPPRALRPSRRERARPAAPARQLRRRGAALEEALLSATWEELAEVGYANLTMEGAAVRAGTGKAVLYRRWPNRAQLALAALRHRVTPLASQTPNTGELREDVLLVLKAARDRGQEVGRDLVYGLLAEVEDLPGQVFEVIPGMMSTVIIRAVERGEIDSLPVPPLVATIPIALLRYELLFSRQPIPDDFLARIVDDVFLPLVQGPSRQTRAQRPPQMTPRART